MKAAELESSQIGVGQLDNDINAAGQGSILDVKSIEFEAQFGRLVHIGAYRGRICGYISNLFRKTSIKIMK